MKARLTKVGEVIVIHSPYDPTLIAEIKAIPGRKYSPELKIWSVPCGYEEDIRAIVRRYFPIEDEPDSELEGIVTRGQLAVLRLEFIGENYHAYKRSAVIPDAGTERFKAFLGRNQSRPWVARVTGRGPRGGLLTAYMKGQIDYSQANSTGSRGVFIYYALPTGIYEVNARAAWKRVDHYFIRVENAEITEIAREEVEQWLLSRD